MSTASCRVSAGITWAIAAVALTLSVACASAADDFPTKPIKLVVAQGTGSGSDVTSRLLAAYLGPALGPGKSVIVENRVGASGLIGQHYVAQAAPDGYTIIFGSTAGMMIQPAISRETKLGLQEFTAVAAVLRAPFAVLVANNPGSPKTLKDLIAMVREKPSYFGSSGIGTLTHLGSELFLRRAGVAAKHIPYSGSGEALKSVITGEVLFATDSLTAAMRLVRAGELRAIAVGDTAREGSLPDVPTLAEAGLPDARITTLGGLFGPKGMPKDVVDTLAAATAKVLANPEVQQRFAALETDLLHVPTETFVAMLKKEAEIWIPFVQQLDLKLQ